MMKKVTISLITIKAIKDLFYKMLIQKSQYKFIHYKFSIIKTILIFYHYNNA